MEKWKNKVTGPICDNLNKSGWGWTNFCSLSGNIRSLGLGTVVEHSTSYVIKKRSTVQQFSGTVNTATKGSYWNHFWRRLFMKRFPSRNQSTLQNCEKSLHWWVRTAGKSKMAWILLKVYFSKIRRLQGNSVISSVRFHNIVLLQESLHLKKINIFHRRRGDQLFFKPLLFKRSSKKTVKTGLNKILGGGGHRFRRLVHNFLLSSNDDFP